MGPGIGRDAAGKRGWRCSGVGGARLGSGLVLVQWRGGFFSCTNSQVSVATVPTRRMVDVDATSRQREESQVQGNGSVGGLLQRGVFDGGREESSRRAMWARGGHLGSVVVNAEDTLTTMARRRQHRARPAARRHARVRRHAWRCKEAACGTLAESRFTATAAPMLQLRSSRWRMALSILRWRRMQAVWTQWMAADHDGWVEQSQSGAKGRENFCTSEPSGDFVADSGAFGAGSAKLHVADGGMLSAESVERHAADSGVEIRHASRLWGADESTQGLSRVALGVQPRTSDVASGYVRGGCVVALGCLMLVSPQCDYILYPT